MAKREFNKSAAIREYVNSNDGVTIAQIHQHLNTAHNQNLDEKNVYAAVMALATKGEIGKGLWDDEGNTLFIDVAKEDKVARALADIERKSNKQVAPKQKKVKTVKEAKKVYSNEEVEAYLRDNMDTEPSDKPLPGATLRFPFVGQMSGEEILNRAEERLGEIGDWYIAKEHGYVVAGFAAA